MITIELPWFVVLLPALYLLLIPVVVYLAHRVLLS